MLELVRKIQISYKYIKAVLFELALDIYAYYTSSFPLLLVIGAYKRILRRIKHLWFSKKPGRPPVPENIVNLILDMKRSNWLWGCLRISQELRLLGINLHKKTIAKILRENGFTTPPMKYQPPTWRSLMVSQKNVWAMDFCNVVDLKLLQVYIIGIIDIQSRELIHLSVTYSPNRNWILQQFRNLALEEIRFPLHIIIDNDSIYGHWIDEILLHDFDIKVLRINYRSPWENGRIERFWQSLQNECIDRIHIKNKNTLCHFCDEYKKYYNEMRPHQSLNGDVPKNENKQEVLKVNDLTSFRYSKKKHLYGMFTEFSVAA